VSHFDALKITNKQRNNLNYTKDVAASSIFNTKPARRKNSARF